VTRIPGKAAASSPIAARMTATTAYVDGSLDVMPKSWLVNTRLSA
jgi:hypothetical protein